MWIFCKTGFLSIVEHRGEADRLLVRARVEEDLQGFVERLDRLGRRRHPIEETPVADYRFRTVAEKRLVARALAQLAEEIEYTNFKAAVHGDPPRDDAYMDVWDAMRELQKAKQDRPRGTVSQIVAIAPYWHEQVGTWVFDDRRVGLQQEPFVSGVPEMLDHLVHGIPDARRGFRLLFSGSPFPGFQQQLTRRRAECGGTWYGSDDPPMEGWLCPALFRYFPEAPDEIYVKAESIG